MVNRSVAYNQGGECGPDYLYFRLDKKIPKVLPIPDWATCAVWDFITLIAPSYGFDATGLIDHYGPDGTLRYGCSVCPLVYNDVTGQYLAKRNPALYELIAWTNTHLRRGGAAFNTANRELLRVDDDFFKDGRLSLAYCKRLYGWLMNWEQKWNQQIMTGWQKGAIQAYWAYRETLPEMQRGIQANVKLFE